MRTLRLALAGLLLGVGLVALAPAAPSYACSCVAGGPARYVEWSDTVFTGTLTEIDEPSPAADGTVASTDPVTYRFDVDRSFEGDVPSEAEVISARLGASCGLEGMQVDTEYVVFATASGDLFESNLCGGTAPAARADLDRVERLTTTPAERPLRAVLDALALHIAW